MTLEFHKLIEQINTFARYQSQNEREAEDKLEIAQLIMEAHADAAFLPYVQERVQDAVIKDAGYRGARPIDEPLMLRQPVGVAPATATIIATDGSQIAPNSHGSSIYYLLNIGSIIVKQGSGQPPIITSQPYLFFEEEDTFTNQGLITANTVAARRTIAEMSALAEQAWSHADEARPLVALLDGPLLFIMGKEVPRADQLLRQYFDAMRSMCEIQTALAGYVPKHHSRFVVKLLHLLDIDEKEVSRSRLAQDGRLEGLRDAHVFEALLAPGERSALFIQMSPQNKEFRNTGGDTHEISFFYMNAAGPGEGPKIARVDIPMWVASDRQLVGELQAVLYQQCQQTPRSRYPYVLIRADELAVVKSEESRQFEMMVEVTLRKQGINPAQSEKRAGKDLARSHKTRHTIKNSQ